MLIIESILFFILYFKELNKYIYKFYISACLGTFKLWQDMLIKVEKG